MIMDVNHDEVSRVMKQYNVKYLLHGHTHRPAIHQLNNNHHRIVLGDWQQTPSFMLFDGYQLQLFDQRSPEATSILKLA